MMEKKKRKINVVDVAIILVAALLIAAFASFAVKDPVKETGDDAADVKNTVITYTIKTEDFTEDFKNLIKVGDEIRNVDFDCEVGKVIAVTPAEPTIVYNYSKTDGKMVPAEVPDSFNQTITVEAKGAESDTTYYVGAIQLKVGKNFAFKTPGFVFKGTVMSIEGGVER